MAFFDPETGITFSPHAWEELRARSVSTTEVAAVIALGHPPREQQNGRFCFTAFIGGRLVRVVRARDGVVVTVFVV